MAAATQAYVRFPHVRGDVVTFVADDDVWMAPLAGGAAWRLSADRAPVSSPRLSPDGSAVAWTSRRHGAPEVYVSETSNAVARRLTYWGAVRTATRGWTADGDVVVVSEVGQPAMSRTWAHALPPDGSPGRRLDYGIVDDVAYGPDGQVLTATSASYGRDPAWWKRYRGGTAAKLWLDNGGTGSFTPLLPDHLGSLVYPMWAADRIFVCADHDGIGRLYALDDALLPGCVRSPGTSSTYVTRPRTAAPSSTSPAATCGSLDAAAALPETPGPQRIEVRLSGARPRPSALHRHAGEHRGAVAVDRTGRPARWSAAARCTGWRTATVLRARCSRSRASGDGCPW
jgi:tricorn protease